MKFEEKCIAFIDILGFKKMVEKSENGSGMDVSKILDILSKLGGEKNIREYKKYGPQVCPESKFEEESLNFMLTQISDCVVISSEVSPAGVINLVDYCYSVVVKLLIEGIMCRGYISKGKIYHTESQFIGSGYVKTYQKEQEVSIFKMESNEKGTPFVEIDPVICKYVDCLDDKCVKKMFSDLTKATEDGLTALFPFYRFLSPFLNGRGMTVDNGNDLTNKVRKILHNLIENVQKFIDPEDKKAEEKARHYIKALEEELKACDEADETNRILNSPASIKFKS